MEPLSISEHIARFVVHTEYSNTDEGAPAEAFAILKLSLMDWCAVALAGIDEPVSTIVREQALADGGDEACHVFGSSQRLPARSAAMVNGTTSHALDYDDTHFLHVGHTSVVVFAAAMAVAEKQSLPGKAFMEAALIGSEVCCYVGNWLGRSHYEAGFHQTATAGVFGAVAAASRLLALDENQTRHALGIAATRAAGLTSQFGTMSKPYHAGMAASVGVEAAQLASRGFIANADGIDGTRGFAETHAADQRDSDHPLSLLGAHYVFPEVQHKLHACCHGLHASIEALDQLKIDNNVTSIDIKRICIETNPRWLAVCNKPSPSTGLESKFSYRHLASLVFSDYNTAALATYNDTVCNDPALAKLRDSTEVVSNMQMSDTATRVSVHLRDNSIISAEYDLAHRLPLDIRQQKLLAKCAALLGKQECNSLWDLVSQIETGSAQEFAQSIMPHHSR
ncbi:MAG: 2-methylcitrate dehydratase PrpD [Porticoccaceae bacterium]|jgi:2-methylcitrate dehydratase PrpD